MISEVDPKQKYARIKLRDRYILLVCIYNKRVHLSPYKVRLTADRTSSRTHVRLVTSDAGVGRGRGTVSPQLREQSDHEHAARQD